MYSTCMYCTDVEVIPCTLNLSYDYHYIINYYYYIIVSVVGKYKSEVELFGCFGQILGFAGEQ